MESLLTRYPRVLATLATVVVVAACGERDSVTEPAEYTLPDTIKYSFRWSAAPDVDLGSPAATAVRAFEESIQIRYDAQDPGAGYPGFEHAIDEWEYPWSTTHNDPVYPVSGTRFRRLLRLDPLADGRLYATYCTIDATGEEIDGKFRTRTEHPRLFEIVLRAPENADQPNTGAGIARYPVADVFDNWKLIWYSVQPNRLGDILGIPQYPEDWDTCTTSEAPIPLSTPGYSATPPPMLPPIPGWPEGAEH